jgi:hypothetical protein
MTMASLGSTEWAVSILPTARRNLTKRHVELSAQHVPKIARLKMAVRTGISAVWGDELSSRPQFSATVRSVAVARRYLSTLLQAAAS